AVVAIMGDVTRERAERIAEELTDGLPRASAGLAPLPPVPAVGAAIERENEHASAPAHHLIGQPGIQRKHPDYLPPWVGNYFPLWVGNYGLGGGGFSSRLSEQVRQRRGLSYSVYSAFLPYQRPGPFQIGLQTRADQAHAALELVLGVLHEFVVKGPTAQELEG